MPSFGWQNLHAFEKAAQFRDDYSELACQTRSLQPVAQAFIRNMNRVRRMGTLPINLTSISIINEAARVEALVNNGVPLHDPRITAGDPKFDSDLFNQVNKERMRLVEEW